MENINNNLNDKNPTTESSPVEHEKLQQVKLDRLPPEIKRELDACITRQWGSRKIKPYLLSLFPKHALLDCALSTYQKYINAHKEEIFESQTIEETLQPSSSGLTNLKAMIVGGANSNQIRQGLEELFRECEARLRLIEIQRRNTPYDPRWESHIASYVKEKRAILETLASLDEKNVQSDEKAIAKELEIYTFALLKWVGDAYRRTNGKHSESTFEEHLKAVIEENMPLWFKQRQMS